MGTPRAPGSPASLPAAMEMHQMLERISDLSELCANLAAALERTYEELAEAGRFQPDAEMADLLVRAARRLTGNV